MAKPSTIISACLPLLNWLRKQDASAYDGINVIVQAIDDLNQKFYTDKATGTVGINNTDTLSHAALDIGGHINSLAVTSGYTLTSSTIGIGNYIWDKELFTTSNNYIGRDTGNQLILCRVPGYYQINLNIIVSNSVGTPVINLRRNNLVVQSSTGVGSGTNAISLSTVIELAQNDYITIDNTDGDRFGDANRSSTLFITRLN